jgi:hypothetical protein
MASLPSSPYIFNELPLLSYWGGCSEVENIQPILVLKSNNATTMSCGCVLSSFFLRCDRISHRIYNDPYGVAMYADMLNFSSETTLLPPNINGRLQFENNPVIASTPMQLVWQLCRNQVGIEPPSQPHRHSAKHILTYF